MKTNHTPPPPGDDRHDTGRAYGRGDGDPGAAAEAAALRAIVLEQLEEGVVLADAAGRVTFVNAAAERLYGGAGVGVGDLVPVGDPRACDALSGAPLSPDELPLARALRTGRPVRDALWRVRRDETGEEVFVQGSATPLAAPDGTLLGAALVLRDVTALRESEDHYRHAVELNPQVPWTADADGAISDFSRRWLDLTGLTRESALGGGWMQVPHPDDLPAMAAAWQHAVATGTPYDVEHRIRLADGTYRWSRSRAIPRRDADGRVVRWYGVTEDIDDRRRAEERRAALEAQQRRFVREVLSSMTEGRLRLAEDASDLPAPLPPVGGGPPTPLDGPDALRALRAALLDWAAGDAVRWPPDRAHDLVTAVHEAAMNALVHAGGGAATVRADAAAGVCQVWVRDDGGGIAPDQIHRATLERGFSTGSGFGHGFWMMLQTCDRVHLLTGDAGTTVVLEQERVPPPPPWLRDPDAAP